jgi:hypothetical protein
VFAKRAHRYGYGSTVPPALGSKGIHDFWFAVGEYMATSLSQWYLRRLLIAAAILVMALFCLMSGLRMLDNTRVGPVHRYQVETTGPFLIEDVALVMAKQAMKEEGYDMSKWLLRPDSETSAPDGRKDLNLDRASNPCYGSVVFDNLADQLGQRDVSIELEMTL